MGEEVDAVALKTPVTVLIFRNAAFIGTRNVVPPPDRTDMSCLTLGMSGVCVSLPRLKAQSII